MFFVTGLFWSSWRSGRIQKGENQTEVRNRSQKGDLLSWGCPGWLPACRRSSALSPPFNVSPTSSFLQSAMFLYCYNRKKGVTLFSGRSQSPTLLRTRTLFTCLPRCGDVSVLGWRSWSMSWPISLKVGLSVGSRLQQRVISSYLGRQGVLQLEALFGGVALAWQSLTFGVGQSPAVSCGSHPGSSCRT